MEESDILGGPTIDMDGNVIMKDGPLTEAVRHGAVYVAEEMNFARPAVIAVLNTLLDSNSSIILPSGEVVKAHPNFKLIGTINPGYAGTRDLNKALINRFSIILQVNRMTDTQMQKIIKNTVGYGNTSSEELELARMLILYNIIENLIKQEQADAAISIRQLINMSNRMKEGMSFRQAFKVSVLKQVSNLDEEFEKKLNVGLERLMKMADADVKKTLKGSLSADKKNKSEE